MGAGAGPAVDAAKQHRVAKAIAEAEIVVQRVGVVAALGVFVATAREALGQLPVGEETLREHGAGQAKSQHQPDANDEGPGGHGDWCDIVRCDCECSVVHSRASPVFF